MREALRTKVPSAFLPDTEEELLIPGPVALTPAVQADLGAPVEPHYGPEWAKEFWVTCARVQKIARATGPVFLLPGSGSAGVEAALGALLPGGGLALAVCNGRFGERYLDMVPALGARVEELAFPWGRVTDPDALRKRLAKEPRPDLILCVHSETSTGVRNPLRELARVAAEAGVPLFVDAVSSLGGIELDAEAWRIAGVAAGSQKSLGGPPGLGLSIFSAEGWRLAEKIRSKTPSRGWYFDLHRWKKASEALRDHHPHLVTMPVNVFKALNAGLGEALAEGLERRWLRHAEAARQLRAGLRGIGWEPFAAEADASETVTCVRIREGLTAAQVLEGMLRRGYRIAGGLDKLDGKVVRIGHMAATARVEIVERVLAAMRELQSKPRKQEGRRRAAGAASARRR